MSDSVNPHASTDNQRAIGKASLGYGFVTNEYPERNQVKVQPLGEPTSFIANVRVSSDGDIAIPNSSEFETVYAIYARANGNTPFILGYFYDEEDHDIEETERGERRIGHQLTDAHIYFDEDGQITIESSGGATVTLQSDGTVSINDGTEGAIYDITTTTDGDGHVTSVSPQRRSDILI